MLSNIFRNLLNFNEEQFEELINQANYVGDNKFHNFKESRFNLESKYPQDIILYQRHTQAIRDKNKSDFPIKVIAFYAYIYACVVKMSSLKYSSLVFSLSICMLFIANNR